MYFRKNNSYDNNINNINNDNLFNFYYSCCLFNQLNFQYQMSHMFRQAPPSTPPPPFTPSKSEVEPKSGEPSLKAVDPGAIKPCLYRFVYIWQTNGKSYWAYLTYIGKKSISGFRWTGYRWVYFGLDLKKIESFVCY